MSSVRACAARVPAAGLVLGTMLALCGRLGAQEERIDDSEYEKYVAVHVRAFEGIEKNWRKDPGAALQGITLVLASVEADLLPRYPRLAEAQIAVRLTRGIDKGEIKERHVFRPYRLAGEIALAAGAPERAAVYLEKSPSGRDLLAEAQKAAAAAREKKEPPPPSPAAPSPPESKPAFVLAPYFERRDYTGAQEALKARRELSAADADRLSEEIRREAARQVKSSVAALAGLLPRMEQPGFREEHVKPCLESCARVPANLETPELRWVRRLDQWLEKRDSAEFERLAVTAAAFGSDFTILCDRAQDQRLKAIESLVDRINRAERADRPRLLDELGQAERSYQELWAAHERPELKDRLSALKSRLPIDEKALDEARTRPTGIAEIRRLADELERLWISDRHARLSLPDQKELALDLGLYRCMALFLDGKSIPEAAQDLRLQEVFRVAGELPADVSPKVAAVRTRIGR